MTQIFILKLGDVDLSAYCRMNPDDKLDPYSSSFLEPSFAETPFADTQVLISTTVQNREQHWPLFLVDATHGKDLLHELVKSINNAISQRPLLLEWRDSGASFSTFYDVVFARFEPDFSFRRSVHGYAAGVLHTWTAGYGHTATARIAGTAAGSGIFLSVPIASVGGDAPALVDTRITAGSVIPSVGRIVAVAAIPHPSYAARIPAASLTDVMVGATLIGDRTAAGSRYLGMPVPIFGGASGIACKIPLPNPTIAGGDNRVLANVVGAIAGGVAINALDPYGNSMGPTAVASNTLLWSLVDLGVCRLPTVGYPTLPKISIIAAGVSPSGGASPISYATPNAFNINEVYVLPDKNLTLMLEQAKPNFALSLDGFTKTAALDSTNDDLGNPWSDTPNLPATPVASGFVAGLKGGFFGVGAYVSAPSAAFDAAVLRSVNGNTMLISAKAQATPALGGEVRLVKDISTGNWVESMVNFASGYLTLRTNGVTNQASTAVGLPAGAIMRLSLNLDGGRAIANLSRDDGAGITVAGASSAFASLSASAAAINGNGAPGLAVSISASTAVGNMPLPVVTSWEVDGPNSANLQAWDSYRIDGINGDSWRQSSAGDFAGQKLAAVQRGAFMKLQPSTSSVAVLCAPFDQGWASDVISAQVSVRERFNYGRS